MSSHSWRAFSRVWCSRLPVCNGHPGHDRLQKSSAAATNAASHTSLPFLRSISSSAICKSSDRGDSPGHGKDGPEDADEKRMWRKWIEERLAQSDSGGEDVNSEQNKGSVLGQPTGNSPGAEAKPPTEENEVTPRRSILSRDFAREPSAGGGQAPPDLNSIFAAAFRAPSKTGNSENSTASNFKNPFRRENVKSSAFAGREINKRPNLESKPGYSVQRPAKWPSFLPARQEPENAPEATLDNLPVEALDEFESSVVGAGKEAANGLIEDDFLRDLDEIGRSARGLQSDDESSLEVDEDEDWGGEKAHLLTDLALSNSEEFDLEDEDNPYRLRPDRLFFPGQKYDPEDLDLSREPDFEKPTVRTRKRYQSKEVCEVADFRNPRYLSNFIRESSKILPKRHFRLSAKAQRKVAKEIKTARVLGLMPFTSMGDPPFRFLKSWSEDDPNGKFDAF